METLLTLMICHAETSFIAAMYRICSIGFDPSFAGLNHDSYTAEEAMTLMWMALRSVADIMMGIGFLISVVRKTQNSKYICWIRYGLCTMIMDSLFITLLVQKDRESGLEIFFVTIDAFVKLCIVLIMHNLNSSVVVPIAKLDEKRPLLV